MRCGLYPDKPWRNRPRIVPSIKITCTSKDRGSPFCRQLGENFKSDLHLENEAAVVAWFVDLYRQHLDEKIFQEELGSFLGMLENTRYENMSLATNYYSSVFVLIQTLAIKRFNLEMLPEVETRIIRRVYEQLTDYIELEKMRKNNVESKVPAIPKLPDGFHFDVDPSIEASTVDQVQLLLFECEQARNYIVEALRKSTTGR
ncbi:hypothetical protein NECAME_04796 [Necator americanus]|uniref:Uncharacterized protein n=1 Tax=Necator americanus TaxID=51031 RepID=W2SMQ9_NECAM|nr:hypothetical protein NECAME_04796 [Necator americanus]ETN70783.1 hypothetical protein NECAME_04796 [Necator americanus]